MTAPASTPAPQTPSRLPAALPLAGLLLFVAGLGLQPLEETDVFFRLALGEQTLRTGAIPHHNLFSFTHPAHPYLDSAWLFDMGAALLARAGGLPALVMGKTLLVVLVFAGAFVVCRRRGAGPVAAALALAVAAWVMRERLVERPHLWSLAGEVAVLAALAAGRTRRWAVLALVPAAALWANLHAGAFLAPVLLLAAGAGALIDRRAGRSPPDGDETPPALLLLVGAGATLALLATPVGPGLFRYLAFHVDINALHPVDEFRPPDARNDAPLMVYAAAVLAAIIVLFQRKALRARELFPALALALLAARAVRFGADFVLVAAPLLAQGGAALIRWGPRRLAPVAGGALALAALGPRIVDVQAGRPFVDVGLARGALPLGALAFVDGNGLRDRMYNDFELGGYLAWQGYPRHRVFVDPRLPAYPRAFHALLGRGDLSRDAWDAALQGFGVQTALLHHAGINRRVAWWDPARWALVWRQDDARVFVRRLPRYQAVIAAHEIPATFSFTDAAGTATQPLPAPPPGSPVPACEWQLRLGDLCFDLDGGDDTRALAHYQAALRGPPGCLAPARAARAGAWLGAALLVRRRHVEALAALDAALATGVSPERTTLHNRALALRALGRHAEAEAAFRQAVGHSRGSDTGIPAQENRVGRRSSGYEKAR